MQQVNIAGITDLSVDESRFTKQVNDYIFAYGLKQMLNDAHASITAKVEADEGKRNAQKVAAAEKKLQSLYDGHVAQARGSRKDAVARLMFELAEAAILSKLPAIGKKRSEFKTATWNAIVAKQVAAKEADYRARAEAALGRDESEDELDIESLMSDESEDESDGESETTDESE